MRFPRFQNCSLTDQRGTCFFGRWGQNTGVHQPLLYMVHEEVWKDGLTENELLDLLKKHHLEVQSWMVEQWRALGFEMRDSHQNWMKLLAVGDHVELQGNHSDYEQVSLDVLHANRYQVQSKELLYEGKPLDADLLENLNGYDLDPFHILYDHVFCKASLHKEYDLVTRSGWNDYLR